MSLTKIAGSGSVSQRSGSGSVPVPYQNVMDPQYWFQIRTIQEFRYLYKSLCLSLFYSLTRNSSVADSDLQGTAPNPVKELIDALKIFFFVRYRTLSKCSLILFCSGAQYLVQCYWLCCFHPYLGAGTLRGIYIFLLCRSLPVSVHEQKSVAYPVSRSRPWFLMTKIEKNVQVVKYPYFLLIN